MPEEKEAEEVEIESAREIQDGGNNSLISPVASATDIEEMYDRFEEIKSEIIGKEDRQKIGSNFFIKKSGWRKIATAFNISTEVVEEHSWTTELDDGTEIMKAQVEAKAEAPNGKSATALGLAGSNESNFTRILGTEDGTGSNQVSDITEAGKKALKYLPTDTVPENTVFHESGKWRMIKRPSEIDEHNLKTLASTRAKNRAISDLVGGGEVSAEEMEASDFLD